MGLRCFADITETAMDNGNKMKVVWMITERGERSFWTRVGFGSVNKDGSINLVLEALPLSGAKLQLRDYVPRDAEASDGPPPEATTQATAQATKPRARASGEARAEGRP